MFGNAFYHDYDCYGDDNIYFFANDTLSKYVKMFIVNMINKNKTKFSYAKQFRQKHADTIKIMLPVDKNSNPDWNFMHSYMLSIYIKKKEKYNNYLKNSIKNLKYLDILPLKEKRWKVFFVDEIFTTIQRGKRLTKVNQIKGDIPYVSSTALRNGVDNFIGNITEVRVFENCITIANSGSVGASFYHKYKFIASDHVTHLKKDGMDGYVYLFISAMTNRFKQKYNFNREINDKRVSREKIMLPICENEEPDFNYMKQYICNLKYKKLKQYMKSVRCV